MENMVIGGGGGTDYYFLAICQILKSLRHFEIFVNTGPHGAKNFKTLLLLQFSSNLYDSCHGGICFYFSWQTARFFFFFNFVAILTWGEWENHETCNILKTADHIAKRMKVCDSQSYILHTCKVHRMTPNCLTNFIFGGSLPQLHGQI